MPFVPHAGVTWPETSAPSAQMALVEPAFEPAAHEPPPPTQPWLSVYTCTLPRFE